MKQVKINKLGWYMSQAIFCMSVLCVNTAWADTFNMVCSPSVGLINETVKKNQDHIKNIESLGDKGKLTRAKEIYSTESSYYNYSISLSFNLDKFRNNKQPRDAMTVKFSKLSSIRRSGGPSVESFSFVQTVDWNNSRQLGFVSGFVNYLDNVVTVGDGYGARLSYNWMLSKSDQEGKEFINPYTESPLKPNEYVLRIYNWRLKNGSDKDLTRILKDGQIQVDHEMDVLPGLHICKELIDTTKQSRFGFLFKPKLKPVNEDKPGSQDSGSEDELSDDEAATSHEMMAKRRYRKFTCSNNKAVNEGKFSFEFSWAVEIDDDRGSYRIFSYFPVLGKPHLEEWSSSMRGLRFVYKSDQPSGTEMSRDKLDDGDIFNVSFKSNDSPKKVYFVYSERNLGLAVKNNRRIESSTTLYPSEGYCSEDYSDAPMTYRHMKEFPLKN